MGQKHRASTAERWVLADFLILLFGMALAASGFVATFYLNILGRTPHGQINASIVEFGPPGLVLLSMAVLTLWVLWRRSKERGALVDKVAAAKEALQRIVAFSDKRLTSMDYRHARGLLSYERVLEEILYRPTSSSLQQPQFGLLALMDGAGVLRGMLYETGRQGLVVLANDIEIPPESQLAIREGLQVVRSSTYQGEGLSLEEYQQRFPPEIRAAAGAIRNYVTYRIPGQPGGALVLLNYPQKAGAEELALLRATASAIGSLSALEAQLQRRELAQLAAMAKLAELAEKRDPDMGEHLTRISHFSREIAQEMLRRGLHKDEVDADFAEDLLHSSPLHDIGKVGVEDYVLQKPGPLAPAEYELIKRHTTIGGEVLEGPEYLRMGRDIALNHHEKWDGTGYPLGKRGEEIPLSARIVTVADVYDALTSSRVYKEALTHEEALEYMRQNRGRHFDPEVLDIFLDLEERILKICELYPDRNGQA